MKGLHDTDARGTSTLLELAAPLAHATEVTFIAVGALRRFTLSLGRCFAVFHGCELSGV
jgi:hypothetical protein